MHKKSLALLTLCLAIFIFFADRFAQIYSWYYHLPWFDMLMHFVGGFFVGLSALYIYYYSNYFSPRYSEALFSIFIGVSLAVIVGVFWEFFEFGIDIYTGKTINGITVMNQRAGDTLGDLALDMFGGFLASLLFICLWQKK